MAQLASASGLGPEGPVFESQYPDIQQKPAENQQVFFFLRGGDMDIKSGEPPFRRFPTIFSARLYSLGIIECIVHIVHACGAANSLSSFSEISVRGLD